MKKFKGPKLNKGEVLLVAAIAILFFTTFINWTFYSWLVCLAIILVLAAWYFRRS